MEEHKMKYNMDIIIVILLAIFLGSMAASITELSSEVKRLDHYKEACEKQHQKAWNEILKLKGDH